MYIDTHTYDTYTHASEVAVKINEQKYKEENQMQRTLVKSFSPDLRRKNQEGRRQK